jgi:peptidoglycan/LPS O-acetylase OafA/YrhL
MSSPRLPALDVVRVLTVGLVISVHTVSVQPGGTGWSNGAVLIVTHVSREVFFLLTAFVLTYAYRDRPDVRWLPFWRRRYLLVGVPYLVWSAIYVLAAGRPGFYPMAVLTGTASYHLYFLLVSMQLYLVFPVLRRLLRATAGRHRALLAAAVAYQIAAYALLPRLITRPDALLISYLGFVIAGGIAAVHATEFLAWTARDRRSVLLGTLALVLAGLGWFTFQLLVLGRDASTASAVFQPFIVVESFAVAWSFLALGLAWHGRWFRIGADASFGVYLSHPLLLQGLLATGLFAGAAHRPGVVVTAVAVTIAVPLIYLTCAVVASALRRTPLSLPLTGHPRRRPPVAAPVVPLSPGGSRCERQTA